MGARNACPPLRGFAAVVNLRQARRWWRGASSHSSCLLTCFSGEQAGPGAVVEGPPERSGAGSKRCKRKVKTRVIVNLKLLVLGV